MALLKISMFSHLYRTVQDAIADDPEAISMTLGHVEYSHGCVRRHIVRAVEKLLQYTLTCEEILKNKTYF